METLEKIVDSRHLDKEELIVRHEWQINNLINPDVSQFITPTETAEYFGKHVVEFNRMLRDIGILVPMNRVGKKGTKDIDLIGWKIADSHRRYLLANGLALEVRETRDAVYWNETKLSHINCYINIYLKRESMPLINLKNS